MSAKWRALQHRHRYTYSAVIFPPPYLDSLTLLPPCDSSQKFFSQLKELASLNSIYSQVNYVKNVASSFTGLLLGAEDESLVCSAAKLYLELLFLENSLPLHRTLVSTLSKNRKNLDLIGSCFRSLCEEYATTGRRFCVSRVALSMMSTPKLGYLVDVVEECCVLVALDAVNGLNYVVTETNGSVRPSPLVMEQCQEALSCLYYLLQRFPLKFSAVDNPNLLERVVAVISCILKSNAFSRDCLVAAGVSFCAALQALLSPHELGFLVLNVVFGHKVRGLPGGCDDGYKNALNKVPYKGGLWNELREFSPLSRICMIRGILTAISRTVLNFRFDVEDGLNGNGVNENGGSSVQQSILFDAILPELCRYCENPTDSHFNFHALTVMQICLQQIKTSILCDLLDLTVSINLIPEELGARIIRIVWNNLEDPLSQTVKQVHLIFDLFLDIKSTLHGINDSVVMSSFLWKLAVDVLRLGPRCKGRYIPLASVTKRLGAKTILDMSPNLLFETAQAYIDDDVCCAATSFLKCFLQCLRDECWKDFGVEKGNEIYRTHCLPAFLNGLASGVSKLRSNLNTYALPSLLEVDVDSIFPMFSFISIGFGAENGLLYPEVNCLGMTFGVEQKVAVLVSLLKVSRSLALFEGDIDSGNSLEDSSEKCAEHAFIHIKGIPVLKPVKWLALALTHVDESLRVDAAESLFLNPKTACLPSPLELNLMRIAVPLNMRCCSTAFQMKWASLFKKFFGRVRTALERQLKQGTWKPNEFRKNDKAIYSKYDGTIASQAEDLYQFMKWFSCFLFFSCYPSAPYERKIMAMELIMIMISVWSISPPSREKHGTLSSEDLYPYNEGITNPESTMLLLGSIIDSWDRLRESSFRILLNFPTPLPGISREDIVQEVLLWAKTLVGSPRVRESDAGALTLRLIFRKYVLDLGWMLRASWSAISDKLDSEIQNGEGQISESRFPIIEYMNSILDWLHAAVEEGEVDLLEACKNSFVHGILLAMRYTFEELDWKSDVVVSSISEMRLVLGRLLNLVMRVTSLALWVVSADALHLPPDMDDVDEESLLVVLPDEMEMPEKDSNIGQEAKPTEQIVMVGCWLAMKEVSLLLGTIIRKIPLPTAASFTEDGVIDDAVESLTPMSDAVLDVNQLETMGNHFLEVLLKMKHNGAIDKTRAGFTALCNRLLCSDDSRLCLLVESWMEQLMERTVAKGQTVDDLLRRSAGIPAAFSAFFLSEPQGAPKKLLPRALCWLIDIAGGSLLDQNETIILVKNLNNSLDTVSDASDGCMQMDEVDATSRSSKVRTEGVIPTVHAFNVLKAAFNDTNLATDTSGFSAEAMIISIRSFSSSHWEIRNSACLAYTALVRRMVGFLNVHKRQSARRSITCLEFFHRYPSLHSFIFDELKVATELLHGKSKSTLASIIHPSLCPVLILLSRLKPSPIASEAGDHLDPFLFMPFIQRCSTQSNMRIRILASRALTSLVSNENLHSVLLDIASALPDSRHGREAAAAAAAATNISGARGCASFNSIHGTLLQLNALLDANCRNLTEFSLRDLILDDLISTLAKCSWIGCPRFCPCPTLNTSLLSVLDHMLSIAAMQATSKNYDVICDLLSKLSSDCLAIKSENEFFHDPTVSQLRKQAAISYFHCVYLYEEHVDEQLMTQSRPSPANVLIAKNPLVKNGCCDVKEKLITLMSDASYEVRLATFKWLLRFVKVAAVDLSNDQSGRVVTVIIQWAQANIQPTLIRLLSLETHHKCMYYMLRILFAWNQLQFQKESDKLFGDTVYIGEMDFESVSELWNILVSIQKTARHTKTLETLVCCFGLCMRRFGSLLRSILVLHSSELEIPELSLSDDFTRCMLLYEWVQYFSCLVKGYSEASQQVHLRKSAGESLVISGLLEQAEFISTYLTNSGISQENLESCLEPRESANMFGNLILDMWFTCIKLLEDEDLGIRKGLALDIQKCFPIKFRSYSLTGLVPSQVEKVIELSFEYLTSVFGLWDRYFNYLLQCVLDIASYAMPQGNLVRRVFDKEIDNYHEEKLLICQICCSHLEKLEVSNTRGPEFLNDLRTWRAMFLQQLTSFASDQIENLGGFDWIGGVGNHKDAFLPLYGNLLGLYVLSKCILREEIEEGACLLSDIIELEKSIGPFLRNPLICNMYLLLIRVHEESLGSLAKHLIPEMQTIGEMWDGFNPYFLLT